MSVTAQPISPPAADDGAVPTEPICQLSVAQYHVMADHGILDEVGHLPVRELLP